MPNLAADDPTGTATTGSLFRRSESFDNGKARDYVLRKRKPEIRRRDSCASGRWSVESIPALNRFGNRMKLMSAVAMFLVAAALLVLPVRPIVAQGSPHVTGVDPASGKPNDMITVSGEDLEKTHVSAVFLSDDKDDHKAVVVTQTADKIMIKVPEVKAGDYNISIQSGSAILIEPVRFTVQ